MRTFLYRNSEQARNLLIENKPFSRKRTNTLNSFFAYLLLTLCPNFDVQHYDLKNFEKKLKNCIFYFSFYVHTFSNGNFLKST